MKKTENPKPPVIQNKATPTFKIINEENNLNNSTYNEMKPTLANNYSLPQNSLISSITNKDTREKNQANDNSNALLIQEITNLKNYVYLLEAENTSLNLRLENPSRLIQRNNNNCNNDINNIKNCNDSNNNQAVNENREDSVYLLRTESQYINRDPFKV